MVTAKLYAKELLKDTWFSETMMVLEDMIFNSCIMANNDCFRYLYIDKYVYYYNKKDPNSLSHRYKSKDLLKASQWYYDNVNKVKNDTIFIDAAIKKYNSISF